MGTILHVMNGGNHKVIYSYIKFINKEYEKDDHYFCIYDPSPEPFVYQESNICNMENRNFSAVMKMIKKYDIVFFHSMCIGTITKLQLLLNKKLMKKIVWIAWGMDLYEDIYNRGIFGKVKKYIDTALKKRIGYFVGIFEPDIDYFKDKYGSKAKTFYAPYVISAEDKLYKSDPEVSSIQNKLIENKTINILIGHQSNPVLNHVKIIDSVSRFKNENIHIYIPLSYGNNSYGEYVKAYAERRLGSKATVITEMMAFDKYMKMLNSIDIAVFDTKRQIGLGNINPLLYMQKKLYLNSEGVMYKYYRSHGINVCDSKDLDNISYNEFTCDVDMKNASEFIRKRSNTEYFKNLWDKVFNNFDRM